MAIIKDLKRNRFYINYKYKTPSGVWKNVNIKNKDWVIKGEGAVGLRYMQSIEHAEIERDKVSKSYAWHDGDSVPLRVLCDEFYKVMKSDGIDEETIYNYRLTFKNHLFPSIPDSTPADKAFSVRNMDKFRVSLTDKGFTPHTVNNKMVAVKNLIKFAKTRKYVSRDMAEDAIDILAPVRESSRISKRTNFFTNGEDDFRKFISSFEETDNEWRIPVLTLFYGALRIGEWQGITKGSVNFDNDFIIISQQVDNHGKIKNHTKTGHDRIVRLPHPFMMELKGYMDERSLNDDDFIFMGHHGAHVSRHNIRNIVNKHLALAGIEHITLHGLRHSFATRMFDKGYDVKEVQEHLGHTSMETTMKYYIHYTESKKSKDLEDLL